MKVEVIKAFLHKGERQEPGSALDLPHDLAMELITLQRVAPAKPLAPPTGPMTVESSEALVSGARRKKGKSDVRQSEL